MHSPWKISISFDNLKFVLNIMMFSSKTKSWLSIRFHDFSFTFLIFQTNMNSLIRYQDFRKKQFLFTIVKHIFGFPLELSLSIESLPLPKESFFSTKNHLSESRNTRILTNYIPLKKKASIRNQVWIPRDFDHDDKRQREFRDLEHDDENI